MSVRRATTHKREFLADSLTPLEAYRRLAPLSERRFLLESITGGEQVSRFSFLGARPAKVYRLWPDRTECESDDGVEIDEGDRPLDRLREVLREIESDAEAAGAGPREAPLPFVGGWVGYVGYDVARLVEHLPDMPPDPFGLPWLTLSRFDEVVVFDHAQQRVIALANAIEGEKTAAQALENLETISELLARASSGGALPLPTEPVAALDLPPASLPNEAYEAAVWRFKEYIRAGDIFQVVPARRWCLPLTVPPLALYRALRMVNPSPYMVLLESPEVTLVSGSPEMVVRKTGGRLETRPIAGTRGRGRDAQHDEALADDLLADPKERAEHVMLVDLSRNDLGRVAAPATVEVSEFMQLEHYSHLMHIVSSVQADLAPGLGALDALLACFPAGTLSGAPKIRAMEIIDELEPEARGVYGGAIGYFSYNGDMDTCIAIRTMCVQNGQISITAGAGIVADSDPRLEVKETENKAAAMFHAVALAEQLDDPGDR